MASVKAKSTLTMSSTVTLELSGVEAAALNEMTGYGIESFLDGYKRQLGEHYIRPHEAGLRSLFETIGANLPREIRKIEVFNKAMLKAREEFED
ncbi:MAG: hypothetical protein V3R25_10045 [Nitrosomonadaceae bacterium]